MKILVDIGHPAHVHFYRRPIELWQKVGMEVIVISRRKEITVDILDALGVKHHQLTSMNDGSMGGMIKELILHDIGLHRIVRREKPDILTGIGGIFVAHTGFVNRIPSIVFYDTENASLSNLITYPLCSLVVVPECYTGRLPEKNLRYPGYHELSYLHPDIFTPCHDTAVRCGLDPERRNYLIRTVSWQANHDLREKGWSLELLRQIIAFLKENGKVIISAEGKLPKDIEKYRYQGRLEKIHHLMAFVSVFIGESATMASECAVLGTPSLYVAQSGRGYTDEQESRYGLVFNERKLYWPSINRLLTEILAVSPEQWQKRRQRLLNDKINVAEFAADSVMNYPESVGRYRDRFTENRLG